MRLIVSSLTCVLGLWLAGCASTPKIDWSQRIGNYSYEQAVLDYGPPDKSEVLSDGTRVAEWIQHRRSGFSVGLGTGVRTGNVGVGVGQRVYPGGSGYDAFRMTFDPQGQLVSFSGSPPRR